jgi:hypothetical protein
LRYCALIDGNTGRVRPILPVYSTYTDRASDGFGGRGRTIVLIDSRDAEIGARSRRSHPAGL